MKNLTLPILLFVITLFSNLLQAQNCANALSLTTLDGNAVTATIPHAGDLFWDGANAGYSNNNNIPGAEVHSIFAGGLWMSGFDGIDLKQAASTYGMGYGDTDYWPGPLTPDGITENETCANWDRHWKINQSEINGFLADFADGGVSVDDIPTSVAGWPARGNPLFFDIYGFELPNTTQPLAPFFDTNGNGIYEPTDGDYPVIKGDQAVFWIFNDAGNVHTESEGSGYMRMEIHAMAYSYASTNENINNATFYDLKFISRAISPIRDAHIGLWIDPDLGCFTDDYFGSIPEKDMAFVYNQDALDGEVDCACPFGISTFCDEIPMMGIRMLKGVTAGRVYNADGELELPGPGIEPEVFVDIGLTSLTYHNNGAFTPAPPPGTDEADTPMEYHNYLSGLWKDGTPMTNTGTGYNPGGGGETTTFAFDGNPSEGDQWSMCSENLPEQDRRMVLGSGPLHIQPGSINTMSFAIFHVLNVAHPCPSFDNLNSASEDVYNLFNGISSVETLDKSLKVSLSPNPFSNETLLQLEDVNNQVERLDLYNVSGQLIRSYDEVPSNNIVIERGNLAPGMYFYKLVTDKQQYVSGKLFVQ